MAPRLRWHYQTRLRQQMVVAASAQVALDHCGPKRLITLATGYAKPPKAARCYLAACPRSDALPAPDRYILVLFFGSLRN